MVTASRHITMPRGLAIGLLAAILLAPSAHAQIVASVDRESVEQNESFELKLIVETDIEAVPDLSVLESDFHIGQRSRLSNTRIDNGNIRRSMEWIIPLMAKRAGELTIPPIRVGEEFSNVVTIQVREPTLQPPGEADVFLTADVDFAETWVQAQVIYTIKIYRAVATRQPALREPTYEGAEVLVELVGDERIYEAILNGRAYNVVERAYAIFPQESGEIQISPTRFEARVLKDGRITGRKVFESESRSIIVNPIPAPPDAYPDAAWLPAREVTLSDNWSRDLSELRAGEPISRNIVVTALGQLETQIPVMEPPDVAGINVYPDKPVLNRRIETGGIRGMRTDQYAVIGVSGGTVTLPGIELPWWDIESEEWRVASAPAQTINILPGDEALAPVVEAAIVETAPTELSEPVAVQSSFWRRIAEILAAAWLLTLVAWWWSSRPRRELREPAPVPVYKQQARHLKTARKAALSGDAREFRAALLEWARLQWPESPPRNIGAVAALVSAPLADELAQLSSASYGPEKSAWDGAAAAQAVRSFAVITAKDEAGRDNPLPPLMPSA